MFADVQQHLLRQGTERNALLTLAAIDGRKHTLLLGLCRALLSWSTDRGGGVNLLHEKAKKSPSDRPELCSRVEDLTRIS